MLEERQKRDKLEIVIMVLAVLLLLGTVVLAGTFLYRFFMSAEPSFVVVPESLILPETAGTAPVYGASGEAQGAKQNGLTGMTASDDRRGTTATAVDHAEKKATSLSLHNRNAGDNTPFQAGNLFPGDIETNYYCVQVSYQEAITVRFHAGVRSGYEKLAEVLMCKVVLLTNGETLYDGLMRDMPDSLDHYLYSEKETTGELYYEITAYLDTSVGNEYQNESLIADFEWWVEEEDNLIDSPDTGDDERITVMLGILCVSLLILILLLLMRLIVARKKEEQDEQ